MTTPYTYLIGWSKLNRWYYGCRFAEGCDPSDLWTTYFTSSKQVGMYREYNGEPDVCQVRKVFKDRKTCREWESRVLKKLDVLHEEKWLNKSNNKSVDYESILRGARSSPKSTENYKTSNKRIKRGFIKASKEQRSEWAKNNGNNASLEEKSKGGIKSGNAAYKNKIGIHSLTTEEIKKNSKKGTKSFLDKWKIPEYRIIHSQKIRLGKLVNRLKRLEHKKPWVLKGF